MGREEGRENEEGWGEMIKEMKRKMTIFLLMCAQSVGDKGIPLRVDERGEGRGMTSLLPPARKAWPGSLRGT